MRYTKKITKKQLLNIIITIVTYALLVTGGWLWGYGQDQAETILECNTFWSEQLPEQINVSYNLEQWEQLPILPDSAYNHHNQSENSEYPSNNGVTPN